MQIRLSIILSYSRESTVVPVTVMKPRTGIVSCLHDQAGIL